MKTYSMDKIRNVALAGPHGVGKTSLADAMLHVTGKVGRRGNVDDGSSVLDYQEESIARRQTMAAGLAYVEAEGHKINLIDTPGVEDFRGDLYAALEVVEGVLFLVKADGGLEVASEAVWRLVSQKGSPALVVINRMNKEHAAFASTLADLQERLGGTVVAAQLPIGEGEGFRGVIDLVEMKAYLHEGGRSSVQDVPADLAGEAAEAREQLMNAAAETDDALVEKFLEQGELSAEEIVSGLAAGVASGQVHPVLLTAADSEVGVAELLQAVVRFLPGAETRRRLVGSVSGGKTDGEEVAIEAGPDGPPVAYAFKRQMEAQGGDVTWLRILSGRIGSGDVLTNSGSGASERMGQMSVALGRQRDKVEAAVAGDIVVAAKLKGTATGTTLYGARPIALPPIQFPEPTSAEAIFPLTAGDEDKMSTGLSKLNEEDPTFRVRHDGALHQTLLYAQGEAHLAFLLEKLKKNYGVEVERRRPRIAFKETIKGKSEVQGRYKKQTGGRGQFGDVWLRLEPLPRGEKFEFVDAIVGGVVPNKFIPAVEKGVRETMAQGVIAGYEVVDMRVSLYFGSYHAVDSSENSFKVAARIALQKGMKEAQPAILEPIALVTITVPQAYMGDVMGDISTRRGQIQGSGSDGGFQVVKALVPEAELYQYGTALRSITQGTGTYSVEFSHYAEVPGDVQKRLIEEYEKSRTGETE